MSHKSKYNFQPVIPHDLPFYCVDALTGRRLVCGKNTPTIYADLNGEPFTAYYSRSSVAALKEREEIGGSEPR